MWHRIPWCGQRPIACAHPGRFFCYWWLMPERIPNAYFLMHTVLFNTLLW